MALHFSEMMQLQQLMQRFGQPGQAPQPQFVGQQPQRAFAHGAPQGLSIAAPPQGQVPQGPQDFAQAQHAANQKAQGNPAFSNFGTAQGDPRFAGFGVNAAAQGFKDFAGQQAQRSPEASADLNSKLANITQLLGKQQKQFSAFGKQQGQLGKQFAPRAPVLREALAGQLGRENEQRAANQRIGGVARRPVPGQRQQQLRNTLAQKQQRRTDNPVRQSQEVRRPTRGQLAGARLKDTAQLRQAQAKPPRRRRVGQGVKSGLARLRGRFNKR